MEGRAGGIGCRAAVEGSGGALPELLHHRRGPGCMCTDGSRCSCCGHTGPSPSMACVIKAHRLRGQTQDTLRLHHYISQSKEHMLHKSRTGEADLTYRNRNDKYWEWVEQKSNSVFDDTLANQSVCREDALAARTTE